MSFNLNGSLYNQALQVQKATKLGSYTMNKTDKPQYTLSYSDFYKSNETNNEKPTFPETHKIDFIA